MARTSAREVRSSIGVSANPEASEDVNDYNERGLLHILQSAGVTIDSDNEESQELELSQVTGKFGEMIKSINSHSDQLGALLHEKLADTDYEILTIDVGATFDSAWMVDVSPPRSHVEDEQTEGEHDVTVGNNLVDLGHEEQKRTVTCSVNLDGVRTRQACYSFVNASSVIESGHSDHSI